MVNIKCKNCGATGYKFCTHGETSRKTYIKHTKKSCGTRIRKPKRRDRTSSKSYENNKK